MKQVGEITIEFVETLMRKVQGKVVYVHPKNYYYVVEFQFQHGTFREAFTEEDYEKGWKKTRSTYGVAPWRDVGGK